MLRRESICVTTKNNANKKESQGGNARQGSYKTDRKRKHDRIKSSTAVSTSNKNELNSPIKRIDWKN